MQAIQVSEVGGPEKIFLTHDVPVPVPGPQSVLVRNRVAGVNSIDTYHR
jgi:NADPH:quinone reductase-like Zn-dependent oxidoreductase